MDALSLFATPVFVHEVPDVERAAAHLVPRILEEAARTPGITASNHGGTWHSPPDLARRGDPAWDSVARMILGRVRESFDHAASAVDPGAPDRELRYQLHLWATVTPRYGQVVLHDHGESHWSVAFYLDPGDADPDGDPDSGALVLVDPRRAPATVAGTTLWPPLFTIRPKPGTLVVFPGWLQHFTYPYRGTRPRVCVSANVRIG